MLASTVQFSTTHRCTGSPPPPDPNPGRAERYDGQPAPDKETPPPPRPEDPGPEGPGPADPGDGVRSLRTQQRAYGHHPHPRPAPHRTRGHGSTGGRNRTGGRTGQRSTLEHHPNDPRSDQTGRAVPRWARLWTGPRIGAGQVLLRKEVIQPHLPVRLPCYDFVPIADPAFDGSLPQGVGPPASGVTDFRDVTGGVYKARERIHRSIADLRLLATPTSWGRVADPNPN